MNSSLSGRTALVTGGGRGIGRAIAHSLAREGVAVAVAARTVSEIEAVAAEIREAGGRAISVPLDLKDPGQIKKSVEGTVAEFGTVDILVNNASQNVLGLLEEQSPDEWWGMMEINVRGPYLHCREVIPLMRKQRWGRIINISSVLGKKGNKYATSYCTSKHGLIGMTRALAWEVANDNITVNAVCPGAVATELTKGTMKQRSEFFGKSVDELYERLLTMIPQGIVMEPEAIAPAVVFLAGDGGKNMTGQAINVSAGLMVH